MSSTRRAPAASLRLPVAVAAAAALLLGVPRALHADDMFAVRDQNPLLRGFYLPLPSDSRADATATLSATLLLSNTLNVESNSHESLLVDGESTVLDLAYESALAPDWRYRISVPIVHDSGGILDSVIDDWHRLFGLPRGFRPYYPKNRIDYSYSGAATIDLDHAQTSVGDAAADVGWYADDDARRTLSIWAGLKAPTGKSADLTSDGAWDGAAWVHAAMRWQQWQLAGELGVSQPFGDELFAGMAHRTSGFTRLAATRALGSSWSLRAQLDGETARVTGTDTRFLGPSLQLSMGAEYLLRKRWRIQMGFSEDIAVNTAPDITFFLGIHD